MCVLCLCVCVVFVCVCACVCVCVCVCVCEFKTLDLSWCSTAIYIFIYSDMTEFMKIFCCSTFDRSLKR